MNPFRITINWEAGHKRFLEMIKYTLNPGFKTQQVGKIGFAFEHAIKNFGMYQFVVLAGCILLDFVIVIIILLVTDSGNYTGSNGRSVFTNKRSGKTIILIIKPWKTMISKPLSFETEEALKPLSFDFQNDIKEDFVPIAKTISNDIRNKDSNFVFFLWYCRIGKSVILSSMLYYLRSYAGV
jgi:hypothetical protein